MDISEKIIESINCQFKFNSKNNIFYFDREDVMKLSPEVLKFMKLNRSDIIKYFETGDLLKIMDYLTDKVLEIFWTSNQYLDLREDDRENLQNIYQIYLYELYSALRSDSGIEIAADRHYERLKIWIENAYPFILNLNRKEEKYIPEIVCAEYSEQLQLSILDIDL